MVEHEHTLQLLDEMGLTTAKELLDAKLEEAVQIEDLTYLGLLHGLLRAEDDARKRRNGQTRLKLSELPSRKTLEDFDFSFQPSIDRQVVQELATLAFAEWKENVLFLGLPGVGKTHLRVHLPFRQSVTG